MIDLYNTLLEKRTGSFRAAMQTVQTESVVRLEASQMLSASESKVKMVSRSRFAGLRPTSLCEVGLPGLPSRRVSA
jgi:hypothetical protein